MSDIFLGIRSFIVVVFTVVTTTVSAILPFDKPIPSPTPTPVVEIKQDTTAIPSTDVLGVKDVQKDKPDVSAPAKRIVSPVPVPLQDISPTTPPINSYQAPNYSNPSVKTDYSSYKTALQATSASLRTRLTSVQSQADRVPQEVNSQINSIDSKLQSDLAILEQNYNAEIIATSQDFGRRGISGPFRDQTLQTITDNYNNARLSLTNKAAGDKQRAYTDAENKIYQADAQDKDLSNKIGIVESLINKISSASFTNSDIPLALQAMNY